MDLRSRRVSARRALAVDAVGTIARAAGLSVELVDGLTDDIREATAAALRRAAQVRSVRVVDEGPWR